MAITSNYISAFADKSKNSIKVLERDSDGKRSFKEYDIKYCFYQKDKRGNHKSMYGDRLSKKNVSSYKSFISKVKAIGFSNTFEVDTNIIFRCLYDNYLNQLPPPLNIMFFDIEVDFHDSKGFAPPSDPFNPIISISMYLTKYQLMVTLVLDNGDITSQEKEAITEKYHVHFYKTEEKLLLDFLQILQNDIDLITGWNSELYDIPYLVNRVKRRLDKNDINKFCLWDVPPKSRKISKYGKDHDAYSLIGIIHLDYQDLYRKYTYREMHSYSLNAIAEEELGSSKLAYSGMLHKLYRNDITKFIEYNMKDTELLYQLDSKLQFIDLTNVIAHSNMVLFETTLGSIAQIDQSIINEIHEHGLIAKNKNKYGNNNKPPVGAYVAIPKTGRHQWIGSMDVNSLYPNIIRACNMSNETIVGQIRHTITNLNEQEIDDYWGQRFACEEYELVMQQDTITKLYVDFDNVNANDKTIEMTGKEIYNYIFVKNNNLILTSNGTIFDSSRQGIIPALLDKWYSERKEFQKTKKNFQELMSGISIPKNI